MSQLCRTSNLLLFLLGSGVSGTFDEPGLERSKEGNYGPDKGSVND